MELRLIAVMALLWAGMIIGISFLESWVKFRAPSLTRPIGLDVGRTVFRMFHRVQNIIFILIVCMSLVAQISMIDWVILCGITLILCAQYLWLLPKLNDRIDIILAGGCPASSSIHAWYGIFEFIKFILLIVMGVASIFSNT